MLGKWMRSLGLAGAICGLCAPAAANTTAEAVPSAPQPAVAPLAAPPSPPTPAARVRVALLLPLDSPAFGAAAQAVRAGFYAAHEREPVDIEVIMVDAVEGPQVAANVFQSAQAAADIVVGPLSRTDVAAVAQSGKVNKPTLALAQPQFPEGEAAMPAAMLAIGLSIEDEARQLAAWAAARKPVPALVVAGPAAWQRRAARAFAAEWQAKGGDAQLLEIASYSGYLDANGLAQLKRRVQEEKPSLLFYALDAGQARQVQAAIGRQPAVAVYGTSQLNPLTALDWRGAEPRAEMNGVRLFDMPWMLQPDHPAVMVYPRPLVPADQRANPDLERLYALGIDAYRIARELAMLRHEFELDGVTGKLTVRFGKDGASFQRVLQPAAYQDGKVQAISREPAPR